MLCSNISWYKRVISAAQKPKELKDMEDLKSSLAPHASRLPLICEVTLYENGAYIPNEALSQKIASLQRLYTDKIFILKLSGKLAPNLSILNEKILYCFGLLKKNEPVLVDLSSERMQLLSGLSDSCFLHPRIYPSLRYYIRQGDEEQAQGEIRTLLTSIKQFTGIKVVISISLQKPFPNIMPLLNMLRKDFVGLVRLIELKLERAPSLIVESVKKADERRKTEISARLNATPKKAKKADKKEKEYHPLMVDSESESEEDEVQTAALVEQEFGPMEYAALDPFELLVHLKEISGNEIDEEDFCPMSMASVLEPFLEVVGIGKFSVRPSGSCGLGACFFTVDGSIQSASASKYIDFYKFYEQMKPLLPIIKEKGIGFFTARSIKKALKAAARHKDALPDLVGYLADSSKANIVNEFVDKLQFLVIHNYMDISALDLSRRCDCTVLSLEENHLVASCSGCF